MSEDKQTSEKSNQELLDELEGLKQQAAENLAGWQRARADYSNLQKEQEKRQKEIFEFANSAAMAEIIPIYNNFKLALKHVPEDQKNSDWIKGIEFIRKQFVDFLSKFKIEEIKTVGEKFNPEIHEAVVCEEKEGFEADVIFEEVMPGYRLAGKVIEPAKVKVAK